MKALRMFLSGLSTGAVLGLGLTPRMGKNRVGSAMSRIRDGADQVPFVGSVTCVNQAAADLKDGGQWEKRLTMTIAELNTKLSSLQELQQHWVLSFNESQRSIASDLQRLRILMILTVTMSCFGVVAFAIVLFLSYVKF